MRFNGYIWRDDNKTELLLGFTCDTIEKAIEFIRAVCYMDISERKSARGLGFLVNRIYLWRFIENTIYIEWQGKNMTNIIHSREEMNEFLVSEGVSPNK